MTTTTPSASEYLPADTTLQNVAYLIGHPIAHSSSPSLHVSISTSTSFPYRQILVESTDLSRFLAYLRNQHPTTPRLIGSGVTMPHKVSVIPHLDHLTPEATAIGAVNTIFFAPSPNNPSSPFSFWGTNTDCIGIRDAFLHNLPARQIQDWTSTSTPRPSLVVGGGGTCRAAIYALETYFHSPKIYILNRDPAEVSAVLTECRARNSHTELTYITSLSQAEALPPPSLIVSAIPDFTPSTPSEKTVRECLAYLMRKKIQQDQEPGALLEMCYHPSPDTQIAQLAGECSWKVIGGIEAMIGQGLEQAKLWAGIDVDVGVIDAAREAVVKKRKET